MEAIGSDLANSTLPLGVGVGVGLGGLLAQENSSPTGRRTPRTPTRSGGVSAFSPQSVVKESDDEVVLEQEVEEVRTSAVSGFRTAQGSKQDTHVPEL